MFPDHKVDVVGGVGVGVGAPNLDTGQLPKAVCRWVDSVDRVVHVALHHLVGRLLGRQLQFLLQRPGRAGRLRSVYFRVVFHSLTMNKGRRCMIPALDVF